MIPLIPLKKDSAQGDFSVSANKKTRQGGWTRKDRELPMDRVNEDPSNHPMAVYPNSTSQSMASPLLPTRDKSPDIGQPEQISRPISGTPRRTQPPQNCHIQGGQASISKRGFLLGRGRCNSWKRCTSYLACGIKRLLGHFFFENWNTI